MDFIRLVPKKYTVALQCNVIKSDCVILRHGHIAITNYHMGDNKEFEKCLSTWDKMYFKYDLIGGYYVKQLKEFRINRGFNLLMLKRFFPHHEFKVDNNAYPCDKIDVKLYAAPRDDFQKVALTFMANQGEFRKNLAYTQQLITAQTGAGKCQPDSTLIPTPTGLKKLGKLKIGDKVFNEHGEPVKILDIFPQKGKRETYEITFKDGRTTRCSPDHLWKVYDHKTNKFKVLPLKDFLDYSSIVYTKGRSYIDHRYSVPMPGVAQYKEQPVPVDPYCVGAFIGNGVLGKAPLTISSGNLDVPAEIARRIGYKAKFRRPSNYDYNFIKEKVDGDKIKFRYVQTKDFFKDLPELIDTRSHNKHIPDIYKYNSKHVRKELLRGLLDTDGSITKNRYQILYTTVSEQLKDDIVELVRSLGYFAYVKEDKRKDKYKHGHCYDITISCPDKDKPKLFKVNRKSVSRARRAAKEYKTKRNFDLIRIIKIEKVKDCKQRCILIDDPDHIYLTENFIPTHNTYCGTSSTAFLSARTLVVVPISILLKQWKESYLTFTSLEEEDILIVQGSKKCEKILEGKYKDVKVFLVMVDTLLAFHKTHGDMETIELLRSMNCYTKIVDEVHRDMKSLSVIEALSNFRMNYYLSASPGRSDRKEDWIFSNLFMNMPKFGGDFRTDSEKHINVLIKKYRFTPMPNQIKQMYRPNVGLNSNSYEKVLLNAEPYQKQDFIDSVETIFAWTKKMLKKKNKILFMCNTVDGTGIIKDIAEKIYPGECSRYYSTGLSKKEKEKALQSKVIIATQSSVGTGTDIPGIQFVLNMTTYSSKINSTQLPGRARALKDGTPVMYIEFVNVAYRATYRQFEKRKPYLKNNAKDNRIMMVD